MMTAAAHPKIKRILNPTRSDSEPDNQCKQDDDDSGGDGDSKGHPSRGQTSKTIGRRAQRGRASEAALSDAGTVRSCFLG